MSSEETDARYRKAASVLDLSWDYITTTYGVTSEDREESWPKFIDWVSRVYGPSPDRRADYLIMPDRKAAVEATKKKHKKSGV